MKRSTLVKKKLSSFESVVNSLITSNLINRGNAIKIRLQPYVGLIYLAINDAM
jgi:hypothetical protein